MSTQSRALELANTHEADPARKREWEIACRKELRRLAAVEAELERIRALEPVAWLWQHCETGRTRIVTPDQIITADASWVVVGPLTLTPKDPT